MNCLSLVLACATGWSLLFVGYLPVALVRRLGAEPIKAAAAWALVAVTAPAAIFHWYLIFALLCLVAWKKLDRPMGKIWLAAAAALGLSLGLIFPLETAPGFSALRNPLPLAALYLGGSTCGLAYLVWVLGGVDPGRAMRRAAGWLPISALGSVVLRVVAGPPPTRNLVRMGGDRLDPHLWIPVLLALLLLVSAVFTWRAAWRDQARSARALAVFTGLAAFVGAWWFEFALSGAAVAGMSR